MAELDALQDLRARPRAGAGLDSRKAPPRFNLANAFEESGLAAQSLAHRQMALAIARLLGMDELVGYIHHNIGNAIVALGDGTRARRAFERALGVAQWPLADLVGRARARLQLAQLEVRAGQFDSAWAQGLQALLGDSQAQRDVMQIHQLLSAVAKARGGVAEALRHHEVFHDGDVVCFNEESARKALARGAPRGGACMCRCLA